MFSISLKQLFSFKTIQKQKHMKKFTFLFTFSLIVSFAFSQNLIENAGFENWSGGQPDSWTTSGGAITLSQNTDIYQEGVSSCQVVFTSDENQNLLSNTFSVEPGNPIIMSIYIYDNDAAGRARISCLYEGADNYYGSYSEDMDEWQMLSYEGIVPDGATSATFQVRFYDVSSGWDGDAEILVDAANYTIDNEIKPEPTNYPTNFSASAAGVNANLSWTDATGEQLPQAYLILAGNTIDFDIPVDGVPQEDDTDLSDGNGRLNISYGEEYGSFGSLSPATDYYFVIIPYTNSGENIDYKVDGDPPSTSLTMPDVSIISSVDFEDNTFGDWTSINVNGAQVWEVAPYGNPGNCGAMSGFDGQPYANEDWLISPLINLNNYTDEVFSFDNAMNYTGPALELYISNDYNGDPLTANWEMLNFTASGGGWDYQSSEIDLSTINTSVHIGFKFTSSDEESATWEVDNLLVTGVISNSINEETSIDIKLYPNPGYGIYQLQNSNKENLNIEVYNVLGQFIHSIESSNAQIQIDISDENNGIYLIHIIGKSENKTISVVKK